MKILNLYSGIGGNRKLWGSDHEITSVENNYSVAKIYKDFFPNDRLVIDDAHDYLLKHFREFDFIWSSPPCPSHSKVRKCFTTGNAKNPVVYPDLKLYEEILFLQGYYKGKYVVENVVSWYKPLSEAQVIASHYIWANFYINPFEIPTRGHDDGLEALQRLKGFNIEKYTNIDKIKTLRNCVEPETGLHIFEEAFREYRKLI